MKKRKSRSPISQKPLRQPGTALQKKITERHWGPAYFLSMVPIMLLGAVIGSFFPMPVHWISIVVLSIMLAVYEAAVYFFYARRAFREIEKFKLGYDGEVYVGQQLDEMRVNGWLILHDFPTGRGNIDHIIISQQGVFTLETKTVSRYENEGNTIYYDCENIRTNKRKLDSPLGQATAEAAYLSDYLRQKLTTDVFVQPVVNYPGWNYTYTGKQTLDECNVWVCQLKGLPLIINNRKKILKPEEVKRIYNFLASENRE